VLRLTDSPPVMRLIGLAARTRLLTPRVAHALRELGGRRVLGAYRLPGLGGLMLLFRHNTTDVSVFDEVFVHRTYEPPAAAAAAIARLPHPLEVADLGANAGYFALFALRRWPVARLTAFEPHPANAALLRAMLDRNRLDRRVRVVEACASTSDHEAQLSLNNFSDSRLQEPGGAATSTGAALQTVAAVDAYPTLLASDFVKVDIEGGEWELLADARLRELGACVLVLEYHPHLAPSEDPRAAAEAALAAAGFSVQHAGSDPSGSGVLWAWRE
jgi:FkbM family methyltransferase